jgi:hypothetical protein
MYFELSLAFYIVSSETASRHKKNVNEDLSLDKPLHVIYIKSAN